MLSDAALQELAYELFELLESPTEFDSIFLEVADRGTCVLMTASRNDRTRSFKYLHAEDINLQLGLDVLRGAFKRLEVN